MNPSTGAISKWKYLLILKLGCSVRFFAQMDVWIDFDFDMKPGHLNYRVEDMLSRN